MVGPNNEKVAVKAPVLEIVGPANSVTPVPSVKAAT